MTDAVNNTEEVKDEVGGGDVAEKLFNNEADKAAATEAKAVETKAAEDKAAAEKAAAEKPAEKKADEKPTEIILKLPEGSKLNAKHVDEIAAFAKERGLSQEAAQAVLERESKLASDAEKAQAEHMTTITNEWYESAKADKEIGGEAFPKHAELAKRVVEKFGSKEFKDELSRTGLGNHPELVRVFVRIGKAMSDDQFVQPGSAQSSEKKDLATKFYGSDKKE
jgi:hypothetical protein